MYRAPPKPFNKVKTGIIMVTAGSIVAILTGLLLYVMFTRFGYILEDYGGFSASMMSMMVPLSLMSMIGGCISFIGGLVARSNPRPGGIVAIVGAIAGGVNFICLIGGVFLMKGNEFVRPQASAWEIPPEEEARWKEPGLKRCPICNAQMPMDARFCPSCGEPFGGV